MPRRYLPFVLLCVVGCRAPLSLEKRPARTELREALTDLESARGGDLRSPDTSAENLEAAILQRIDRLAFENPDHPPTLVAKAALAYESRDFITAQKHLDQALRADPTSVPATLLRVRIAAEQGNLPFARRKLDEQLALHPDHAGLHQARAGILYLTEDYEEAMEELDLAERLGATEVWRLNYHRGLIAEATEETELALEHYQRCLEENPDFEPALRRERWLNGRDIR